MIKRRFPYKWHSYKGIKRERAKTQPHANTCTCRACFKYLQLLSKLNPERWDKEMEKRNFSIHLQRNPDCDCEKCMGFRLAISRMNPKKPDYVAKRDMLQKNQTLNRYLSI